MPQRVRPTYVTKGMSGLRSRSRRLSRSDDDDRSDADRNYQQTLRVQALLAQLRAREVYL